MPEQARHLATILFLDIVGSTGVASRLGDARFRDLTARFYRLARRELGRHAGREQDTAGDGLFATFANPTQAIRCAVAIAEAAREIGLEIRAGLHTGEVQPVGGGKAGGIAVVIGSRVMSLADAGDVLVSGTTHDLAFGSTIEFEAGSAHDLRGVPGSWVVHRVAAIDGRALPGPLADAERAARLDRLGEGDHVERRWTRLAVLIAGVGLIALAGLAVANGLSAGDGGRGPSLLAVDPVTNAISGVVDDGVRSVHRPQSIYYDGANLWQSTPNQEGGGLGKLVRRDSRTGVIQSQTDLTPARRWASSSAMAGSVTRIPAGQL